MKFLLMKCISFNLLHLKSIRIRYIRHICNNLYFYANLWKHNKILRIRVIHVNGDRLISYNSITLSGYISNMKAL